MAEDKLLPLYGETRDRFVRTALLVSGLSILGAASSRLPTWEVAAPVEWLAGSVNVGFLPTIGPLLIAFGYSYLYLTWQAVIRTWRPLLDDPTSYKGPFEYEFDLPAKRHDVRGASALFLFRLWCFGVPVLAYIILLSTYFDFCAPSSNAEEQIRLCTLERRVLDLTIGTSGWGGFKPRLASIQDNLLELAKQPATKADDRARLERLAAQTPWIYPPLQTWLNLAGLAFIINLAVGAWGRKT
jgi:hypothetical protein